MTDETAAIDVHGVQQSDDILGQTGGVDGVGRLRVRVLALSESSKVRRYQPVAVSEPREDRLPRRPEFGLAVQQHQRRANACLRDVMTNPTCGHEAVLNVDHAHASNSGSWMIAGFGNSSMKIVTARAQPGADKDRQRIAMEEIEAVVGELRPNERADGPSPMCLTTSLVTISALSPGSADPLAWSLFLAEKILRVHARTW